MARKTLPKLPKEFKKKWVKSLRSNNYIQTKSVLYNGDEKDISTGKLKPAMCCLGVACYIAGAPKSDLMDLEMPSDVYNLNDFPKELLANGPESLSIKLSKFNDIKGWSFKKIASYIERYL